MKPHLALQLLAVAAAVLAPALTCAAPTPGERAAQTTNTPPPIASQDRDAPKPGTVAGKAAAQGRKAPAPAPPGIGDILKMLDAGVSTDVVKTYVENSTMAYQLSAGDVIALKEHGATDDLTTVLLKRGAELRAQDQVRAQAAATGRPGAYRGPLHLDPESYDYFQYYYLYPRSLAAAYERLAPYGPGPYGYGGYPAYGPPYGPGGRSGFGGPYRH